MHRYILGRIVALVPILLGVALLVFVVLRILPGDAATTMMGLEGGQEQIQTLRAQMGLDRPMVVQFGIWAGELLRGNLGNSFQSGKPVLTELIERVPVTLYLTFGALVVALVIAIPLGIFSAVRRNSLSEVLLRIGGLIGLSVPNFWFAIMLVVIFSLYWRVFPSEGYISLADPLQSLQHLVLPAVSLGLPVAAVLMRMTRSSMLEVLREDYIRTARAKGLHERAVIYRHGLRNAFINVLTQIGMQVGYLLGGSVVIETIFGWPGIGHLAFRAVSQRDYPLTQGVVLFIALCYSVITILVDLFYTRIDPRIRYE